MIGGGPIKATSKQLFELFTGAFVLFIVGCAHHNSRDVSAAAQVAPQAEQGESEVSETQASFSENNLQQNSDLNLPKPSPEDISLKEIPNFDLIKVDLRLGKLVFKGGVPRKKAKIHIEVTKGGSQCKTVLVREDSALVLKEDPETLQVEGCEFLVDFGLNGSTSLNIHLKRGKVSLEDWHEPADVYLGSGDIDLTNVGAVNAICQRCTLSGYRISGSVRFNMDFGNVGLAGLTSSVEGQTLGDIILQWKKIQSSSFVKLHAFAGDVILSFPRRTALNMDVKALRGEVVSKIESAERGIPVSVVAETGQVKVLHKKAVLMF